MIAGGRRFGERQTGAISICPCHVVRRVVADTKGSKNDFVAFHDDAALDEAVVKLMVGLRDIDDGERCRYRPM